MAINLELISLVTTAVGIATAAVAPTASLIRRSGLRTSLKQSLELAEALATSTPTQSRLKAELAAAIEADARRLLRELRAPRSTSLMVAGALLLGAGIWGFVGDNLQQRFGWPDWLVVVIYTVPAAAAWVLFSVRRIRRAGP